MCKHQRGDRTIEQPLAVAVPGSLYLDGREAADVMFTVIRVLVY